MHAPEDAATAFLEALNVGDWEEAARWIDPDVAGEFQRESLLYLESAQPSERPPLSGVDTHFFDPRALLGGSAAELRALSPTAFLARHAGAVHLPALMASRGLPSSEVVTAISRQLLSCTPVREGRSSATVRVIWHRGEQTIEREVQVMPLVLTRNGWRVADADFVGTGSGTLRARPPAGARR